MRQTGHSEGPVFNIIELHGSHLRLPRDNIFQHFFANLPWNGFETLFGDLKSVVRERSDVIVWPILLIGIFDIEAQLDGISNHEENFTDWEYLFVEK